jgi:hypothetical protein
MTMDSLRKPVPAAAPKALRGVANSLDAGKSVSVDVSGAHDKAGFMLCLARDLDFPPYFGGNWDAVEECLADMDWESGVTTLIRITHAARLKATEPSVLTTFAEIIRDLAERSRIPVQVSVIA